MVEEQPEENSTTEPDHATEEGEKETDDANKHVYPPEEVEHLRSLPVRLHKCHEPSYSLLTYVWVVGGAAGQTGDLSTLRICILFLVWCCLRRPAGSGSELPRCIRRRSLASRYDTICKKVLCNLNEDDGMADDTISAQFIHIHLLDNLNLSMLIASLLDMFSNYHSQGIRYIWKKWYMSCEI